MTEPKTKSADEVANLLWNASTFEQVVQLIKESKLESFTLGRWKGMTEAASILENTNRFPNGCVIMTDVKKAILSARDNQKEKE